MTDYKDISIGVDIGGSHITCAAIDLRAGRLIAGTEKRAAVNHRDAADDILAAWASAINRSIGQIEAERLAGIGFAIPGPFRYLEGVSKMKHKFAALYDLRIPDRLGPKLSTPAPMRFLNDATSFAVGEAWLGVGRGFDRVVAITLGTGFGSAFVDRGVPITQRDDVPPEGCLWHLPYEDDIADAYFSTRWFVKEYEKATAKKLEDAKAIAQAAESDPDARELFQRFGRQLADFLIPWFRKFRAERLVIGGNIARAYPLFGPSFEARVREESPGLSAALSELGEKAALIGGGRLFEEDFWEQVRKQLPAI